MPTDEQLWYQMMDKPAKADPLAEARRKAQEEEEAAAKAEEEELKQKTADILRGPKAAAKSLAKSAAMIAADPMGANPEAAAEVVERGAEYLGKGYDYLKEKISPEEVAGPAAAIAAFDPELFRGSKITTETGEPLTLYHGTRTSRGFDEFDLERIGQSTDSGWLGRGIYFNTDPKIAAYYAGSGVAPTGLDEIVDTRGFAPVGERGSILRATASIKNPYEWGPKTNAIYGLMTQGQRLPDDIHDAVIRRAGYTPSLVEMGNLNPEWSNGPARKKAAQKLSQALQDELTSRGYDGVRATLPRYEKGKLVGTDYEVVAFRPEQVQQAPRAAAPETPRTSRPKRGGQGTVGTIGGIAGLGISGVLAAQAAKGAVPEEVRESGVEAFYRFKGGKPVEARELDPKSKAVQAFVENEEALQWALQNNRISEDAHKQLSSLRK
jgi:hypothetical protein